MGASITLAGESLISQKQSKREALLVSKFVLANVPGLDTTQPVDREAGVPAAEHIVHSVPVTREGYLATNKVVYSLMLGSDIGDFDFNWIGLVSSEDVLVITAYVPRQQKRKEIPPLQAGNNLTRNIILEYDGAQSLTGINVPASSWQFDFTADVNAINTQLAELKTELAKKVDLDSWTPPAAVSVDGPVLVYPGSTNTFTITDFNRFSVYDVTTTLGTVSIEKDVVTLVVPTVAAAGLLTLGIERDGAKAAFRLPVGAASIVAPTIMSPANLATGVALDVVLTASPFEVYPAGFDTHQETRWQIALDEAFTQIVFDKTSAADLESIRPGDYDILLAPGKRHYARAFYIGDSLRSEANVSVFNTATTYIRRPSIVSPVDGQAQVSRGITFTSDPFSVYGGADVHVASRFQVTAADTGQVVQDSGWVASPLTSFKPSDNLPMDTLLDVHVRYRGQNLGETEWSLLVRFRTAAQLKGVYTNAAGGATARIDHAAASVGGLLYVMGGQSGGNGLADLWCYNPATNAWTQKASAPEPRFGHTLSAIGGKLYCFGGRYTNAAAYKPQGSVFVYDPVTDKWSRKTAGIASYMHGAAVLNDKLYIYGGVGDGTYLKSLRVYDPVTDKWTLPVSEGGPDVRYEGALIALANQLYYFAGRSLTEFKSDLWAYDLPSAKWTLKAAGPAARSAHSACEYNGRLYSFGGSSDVNSNAQLKDAWMYDPDLNEWMQLPNLATARAEGAAAVAGDSIFIHGGILPPYTVTNTLLRID